MASVDSGDQARDDHLRSADHFDVDNHPTASFRSTEVRWSGRRGTVRGGLTIKPVTLEVDYLGHALDPWGSDRAVYSASATINREDWGLTWNMALEAGGILVSRVIRLELEVETILQAASTR
jgi:polyisoprenoid-binding protein YceI